MTIFANILILALLAALPSATVPPAGLLTVRAANRLPFARPGQTLELSAKDLAPLGEKDLAKIRVKDAAGNELLCQAVDTDGDFSADQVVFQADFAPSETRTFTVSPGNKWVYTGSQFRAFGRFARERFDDFAWENDRIAHRMYGKALETWVREPLTSSTVDIWSKRVTHMVINNWYMLDNYHVDTGEGADFYSAGVSRGCGGNGLWADDRLWVSRNFTNSRVLANGPIRIMFELAYEAFDVSGRRVEEIKRISLDAGQNLDRFRSTYRPSGGSEALTMAVGLKKVAGDKKESNAEKGWLVKWEKVEKNAGNQGLAIIVDSRSFIREAEDRLNYFVLTGVGPNNIAEYWSGFYWDRSGQFADFDAWKAYVDHAAQGLASPIEINVSGR